MSNGSGSELNDMTIDKPADKITNKITNKTTDEMGYLTFALAKGRLSELAMKKLSLAGYTCDEMAEKSRKLIFTNEEQKLKFFLAKADDVPTYVEYGAADIGIVGKDTIDEYKKRNYELFDFEFGKCRVVVAGKVGVLDNCMGMSDLRVATKYPNIAKDYFYNKRNQTVEIIKLHGSVELAPIVGLADVIVDIVETGSTLKENGLVVLDEICDISARLIVNSVSMKIQNKRIAQLIQRLGEQYEKDIL